MKQINNRQNRQAQRACGRRFSETELPTYRRKKPKIGTRKKSQKRTAKIVQEL